LPSGILAQLKKQYMRIVFFRNYMTSLFQQQQTV